MANFRSDGSLFVRALLTALVVGTLLRDAESRRRSSRANYYYGHRRQPRTPWTPSRWSVSENSSTVTCFERDVSYTSAVHNVVSTYLNNAMSEWSDADFRVVRNVDDVELSYDEWLRRIVLDPSQFDWHGDGFAGSTESVKRRARRRTALVSHLIRRRGIQWGRALSCASDSVVNGAAKVRGDVRGAVATTFRRLGRHDNGPAVSALLHVENGTARPLRRVGLLRAEEREDLMARADSILRAVYAAADDQELWEDVTRDQKGAVEDLAESIQKDKYRRTNVWKTFVDMTRYDPTEKGEKGGEPQTTEVPTILSKSILDASPAEAFALFCDNDRVHEYNDNCQELVDIEDLDEMTKVNWCATGKFGPFKARDFVSLVHHRPLPDGEYSSVATNIIHRSLPPADGYIRSEIALSATFFRPVPGHPDRTQIVQMTQVGTLGGAADSALAKRISQNLQETAPIEFFRKFNRSLICPTASKPEKTRTVAPFPSLGASSEPLTEA